MKNKNGKQWANVKLTKAQKGKCVIAFDEGENWYLLSNSSLMIDEPEWAPVPDRPEWWFRVISKKEAELNLILTIFK